MIESDTERNQPPRMEDEILNELNDLIEEYDPAAPAIDDHWVRLY